MTFGDCFVMFLSIGQMISPLVYSKYGSLFALPLSSGRKYQQPTVEYKRDADQDCQLSLGRHAAPLGNRRRSIRIATGEEYGDLVSGDGLN